MLRRTRSVAAALGSCRGQRIVVNGNYATGPRGVWHWSCRPGKTKRSRWNRKTLGERRLFCKDGVVNGIVCQRISLILNVVIQILYLIHYASSQVSFR